MTREIWQVHWREAGAEEGEGRVELALYECRECKAIILGPERLAKQ